MISVENLHELPYGEAFRLLASHVGEEVRIVTPDLSWMWRTQYPSPTIEACHAVNHAMRRYRFVYNFGTLEATLLAAGFSLITRVSSEPGTLVVEAGGTGGRAPAYFEAPREMYTRDVNVR
ncbi:MAG TPA: hypothetical protein VGR02_08595 [Thermoanaerobaculia bacterium]|nr:hypothetical protein [Thermoanaerobaculia bacterium]